MSEIYTVIVVILGILAVSGLFVGVSNDAVNFLNSAIGSKAAPMKTILLVASIGILLGTVTSSGMMEVARNGMFNPGLFSFHEVMMLYMGVMFANVILLDLYNSMGLPTSTTVSLIFCLLGAAVAVSIYKISNDGALGMGDLNHFINTGRAMGIVSAILLSVVIAFTFGTLIMYISRLIFSFRYTAMFRRFGAFWCGASFTAILYFAVFKGLKTPLAGSAAIEWIDQHILLSLFLCWAVGSLLLFFLQRLKINILRLTILSGTFALALAFAGNDLVNFIGVPVAGFDAYSIARHAGDSTILMEGLNASVPANFLVLMTAGVIMIVTLWTSKKAMHVTETEISLSTQGESETQYGSSLFSRTIVRAALNASNAIDRTIPKRIRDKISSRFQYEDIEHSGAPYDMIRATVNLTTSAMLISVATSLKLPLSTTYVCFMVAMGSSLADKAWGRESAVYRISGVMTVVAGWFITAVGGFLIALAMGLILIYGGIAAFVVTTLLCGYIHIRAVDADGIAHVKLMDATPIGINVRSTVATYAGIHDELRKLYAKSPDAKALGYKAGDFSYNTGTLRCPGCDGTGVVSLDVQFLPDVNIPCPDCRGSRYSKAAYAVKLPNKSNAHISLPELMDMDVNTAIDFCRDIKSVSQKLEILKQLGLGYLTLGEETPGLSGGEAQRLKLASEIGKTQEDSVFVFDEPSIGLHPLDVQVLLGVFQALLHHGATVVVIEHDLDVIKNADYIIDMGPGGGEAGGQIIASGTPQEIKENPNSVTGSYIS